MKTEFAQIISELKETLTQKTELLQGSENFNAYTQGKINNVSGRITGLEASANDIVQNYSSNPEMRINFKKRANEIKKEIDDLM